MVRAKGAEPVCKLASDTATVNAAGPELVGVPVIAPLVALS
jgi:hypothetical protein